MKCRRGGRGRLLTCSPGPPPFYMDVVNIKRCTGCTNAVSWLAQAAHAMNTTDEWRDANTVHGPPLQARVVAANRTVLENLHDDPGTHGNEQGAGICKTERGKKNDEGSRHGMEQPADEVGRPLAVQCRLVEGVRWCWPLRRRARTSLSVSLPPIAFACLCPYPLP